MSEYLEEYGVKYKRSNTNFGPDDKIFYYRWVYIPTRKTDVTKIAILKHQDGGADYAFLKLISFWNRSDKWIYGPLKRSEPYYLEQPDNI